MDTFLQKERVPFGPGDQYLLEWLKSSIVSQKGLQEFVGAFRGQRINPKLHVEGLASPTVLVLGPVVDEQEDTCRRQALNQAVQCRLALRIDPVEVLEDKNQRLELALPKQEALDRL